MKLNNNLSKFLCSLIIFTGCSLTPTYQQPDTSLPSNFSELHMQGESIANIAWWDFFQDENLRKLITSALNDNRDLAISVKRIYEARALLGFTQADQYPIVNLSASAQRVDSGALISNAQPTNDFGVFGDLTFEVDLWGKLASATEAQRQELLASEFAYRSMTISLVSQVADLYFRLIDLDNRISIADRTIKNRHNATNLIKLRFEKGIIPELDVNQAEIEEFDAQISRSSLVRERALTEHAMRLVLGKSTGEIIRSAILVQGACKHDLPVAVPALLLERRPDIKQKESLLKAEYERVGISKAQELPAISLFGSLGLRSSQTDDLFSSQGRSWGIGAGLLSPLIDWGKNRQRVEAQNARLEQAALAYQQTVLRAVQEVEDALIGIRTYEEEHLSRQRQLKSSSNASRLSWARYNDGVAPYLEVLDIDRSQFSAELSNSLTLQKYLSSIVQLYKAVGGGWEIQKSDG